MSFYTVNGQEIHVHEEGKPGKKIVLLIHGWSSSWYAMSPIIPQFTRRFHCLAVDLPGYGQSPPLPERVSMEAYADLLAGLIQQINPGGGAILIGHSMGGMVSLTLGLRHPKLVDRMVLLCPTISGNLSLFVKLSTVPVTMLEWIPLLDKFSGLLEPHVVGLADRIMRPASFAEHSNVKREDYNRLREDARRAGQGRIRAECFWAMQNGDLRGRLNGVKKVPALVIWGMEDNTVPLRDASALVEEWPDIDLRILPTVSHWPQFEAPDLTLRYIKAFMGKPTKLLQAIF